MGREKEGDEKQVRAGESREGRDSTRFNLQLQGDVATVRISVSTINSLKCELRPSTCEGCLLPVVSMWSCVEKSERSGTASKPKLSGTRLGMNVVLLTW
jgi:hypothetical protein